MVLQKEESPERRDIKRIKTDVANGIKKEILIQCPKVKAERCSACKQYVDTAIYYNGHPNNSVEEFIALTDERLSLFTGEENITEGDEFPTHKAG